MISKSDMDKKRLKVKLNSIIFGTDTWTGKVFDVTLIVCIILSVLITIFETTISNRIGTYILVGLEIAFNVFFTAEYILRIYCARNPKAYIFSFFGIIDLISILPFYLSFIFRGAQYFLILRSFRLIRVFRVFKMFNFIEEGNLLLLSIKQSMKKILVFFLFILIVNICVGTLMYIVEYNVPGTHFTNIPDGIYWSIVTMTTVGYGDITPITAAGKFLSAVVMLMGYTIMAVPTGIVSASMVKEQQRRQTRRCPHCGLEQHDANANFCQRCGADLEE